MNNLDTDRELKVINIHPNLSEEEKLEKEKIIIKKIYNLLTNDNGYLIGDG